MWWKILISVKNKTTINKTDRAIGRNRLIVIFNIFRFYYGLLDSASSQDGEGKGGRFLQHHRGHSDAVLREVRSTNRSDHTVPRTISCMRHAQRGRRRCWSSRHATTRESQSQRLMNLSDASLLRCVEDELMPVAQLEVSNDKPRTWLTSASSARQLVEGGPTSSEWIIPYLMIIRAARAMWWCGGGRQTRPSL
jgi:hypothetical protein